MTATYRIGANLNVYPGRERQPIGTLLWTFEGWRGRHFREAGPEWDYTSAPEPTKEEAAREVAERRVFHLQMLERDRDRQAAWKAFNREARAALKERIALEATGIVRACRKDLGHLSRGRLDLSIRFRQSNHTSGHARGSRKVVITVSPLTPWWEVQWLLTHELAHCVRGTSPKGRGRNRIVHGPRWQTAFCRIAERAHKVDCWDGWTDGTVWSRTRGVDRLLSEALKAL